MNIYTVASKEYIVHALELIFSIRKFSKKNLNIFLMIDVDENEITKYQDYFNNIKFNNTNITCISNKIINEKMDNFYLSKIGVFSKITFGKMAIPYIDILNKYDKLLLLDCDVLIKNYGLDELYDLDISNVYCAACDDVAENSFDKNELLLCNINRYFNGGMMLLNWKKIINDGLSKIIKESFVNHHPFFEKSSQIDQSFVNFLFKENVLFVDPKYNLLSNCFGYQQYDLYLKKWNYIDLNDFINKAVVIHFIGRAKPWHDYNFVHWQQYQLQFRYWQKQFYENNKLELIFNYPNVKYFYGK